MTSRNQHDELDWTKFWVLEVLLIAAPTLTAIFLLRGRRPISSSEVGALSAVLILLTLVNLLPMLPLMSRRHRKN